MNLISVAKIRGFWADCKNLAGFLSRLLRQGECIATEWGNEGLFMSERSRPWGSGRPISDGGCP